ncbi:MAG: Rossmann-like and DUF2520 domain-containing protein [Candidatus Dormibacteria bacterium]
MTETERARGSRSYPAPPPAVPPGPGEPRPRLAFVGAGRAGGALAAALAAVGYPVVAISGRDPERASALAERVGARPAPTALAAIRSADLTFLTVPDAAVTPVAAGVAASGAALRGRGVVHCSASLGIEELAALRLGGATIGCLHPLQALAGVGSAPLLRGALMLIDADASLEAPLHRIARDLGGHAVALAPGSRPLYHSAAVLAGNAPLALLHAATALLVASGLEPRTAGRGLLRLMEGALANARRAGPEQALTGPAARGDAVTVARHLAVLREHPDADVLYRAVSREIVRLAGVEGREEISELLDDDRQEDAGVRAERRFAAGAGCNRAEARASSASQGARTPGPERRTTLASSPNTTEDQTCP